MTCLNNHEEVFIKEQQRKKKFNSTFYPDRKCRVELFSARVYKSPTGGCSTQLVRMFIESRNVSSSERRDSDIFPHGHTHACERTTTRSDSIWWRHCDAAPLTLWYWFGVRHYRMLPSSGHRSVSITVPDSLTHSLTQGTHSECLLATNTSAISINQ